MFGIVFLSLVAMTAVVGGIGVMMFMDVAFSGPRGRRLAPVSCPPRLAVGNLDGAGLALRVERAVSRAVAGLSVKPAAADACDAACYRREIHVTTPEALAIVQELRERLSPVQVDGIHRQAQRNLSAPDGAPRCPLLLAGGFCACAVARPVSCRTRCLAGADSPAEARRLAESVGAGVTEVFRDCLQASGLDDSQYELNHAIVRVLETPHAARRWAKGERLLDSAIDPT